MRTVRCFVCGRVVKNEDGTLSEKQYAQEDAKGVNGCEGCGEDFKAALAAGKDHDAAFAIAQHAHHEREGRKFDIEMKRRLLAIADGKNPFTGQPLVEGYPGEVALHKANAFEQLERMSAERRSAGAQMREALGL